jgi:methylated-DNA-[protein]-cysteine S-methyltransferase
VPQLALLTPLGDLTLTEEDGAIVALDWGRGRDLAETALLREAADQVQDWFDGIRTAFTLPLAPGGSAFRRKVLQALMAVPYGTTVTYGTLARQVGSAPRAIGGAVGANPLPIVIPCHRVLARNGPGGYSGADGLTTKAWLLRHEATFAASPA